MKTIGLIGLLLLLSIVAYSKVAGAPSDVAQGLDRALTLPAPAATGSNDNLPVGLSEYVFLHHARLESIPVHAMAGVTACP
ncbi:MAG TPA: hypothetical protein VFO57_02045 [Burkholderiales bacterium]|nr:hypothetical protein [Burkholderiales bacterium]